MAARQLGFGQVPPSLFFVGKVQFRGALNNALTYDRLKDLEPNVDMAFLANWQITPFATTLFTQWWSEWQEHIFCKAANLYYIALNENYLAAENEVRNQTHLFCCIIMFISNICLNRAMTSAPRPSAEVVSRFIMRYRSISPISAMMLQL